MREAIGLIIIAICIYFFGWWGLLSILVVMPFIGWRDRHKGPFPTNQGTSGISDYTLADNIAKEMPKSFRTMQDLLSKTSKESITKNDLIELLAALKNYLREENQSGIQLSDKELLTGFVEEFSQSFPNWKAEYIAVNILIEKNY